METFGELITRMMAQPQVINTALNRRDEQRVDPVTSPLNDVLPVRLVNSHVAEGVSDGYADAVMVPTAVDGDWAPVGFTPGQTVWKGETQRFTLKQTLTARERRLLQAELDAATLGRIGQTPMEVAQAYFNRNFVVRTRRAAEAAEALATARAVTSGVINLNIGVGWKLDYKLPGKSRTGANNYVQNPENFWADDAEARLAVGGVAVATVMNDVTFNAILGASPAKSGIIVMGEGVDLGNNNTRYTIRRLSKLGTPNGADVYDTNSLYPDGRFAPRQITVIGQTVRTYKTVGEGEAATVAATEEKLVEDGVIAYRGLAQLGYLHVGPNDVDSNLGRVAQLWKPDPQRIEMIAEENFVPVLTDRDRMYVLRTSLTSGS